MRHPLAALALLCVASAARADAESTDELLANATRGDARARPAVVLDRGPDAK